MTIAWLSVYVFWGMFFVSCFFVLLCFFCFFPCFCGSAWVRIQASIRSNQRGFPSGLARSVSSGSASVEGELEFDHWNPKGNSVCVEKTNMELRDQSRDLPLP